MLRIRPLTEEEAHSASQSHFQGDLDAFGTILPSTGLYAYCPPILDGVKALGAGVEKSKQLSSQLQCLLNIKVAAMVGCPF